MIDITILCPLNIEYNAVREHLTDISYNNENQFGLSYEEGKVMINEKKWTVALFETGGNIGNLQTRTTQILHSLKPNYVFLVGIAAGIKDVSIGDIIVGTKAYGYESGKETEEGFHARPDVIYSSKQLVELAKQVARENQPESFKIEFGAIAGGNRVINTEKNTLQIIKRFYNDTKALEMESIGFSRAAQEAKVSFLNIRGISDLAINKNDSFQGLAARRAAEFAIQLIKRLPNMFMSNRIEKIPVYWVEQPFKTLEWRMPQSTILTITQSKLQLNERSIEISNIKTCSYIRMKGDFGKNWIKIELRSDEAFYFSKKTIFPGIHSVFGGNRGLFKKLKRLTNTEEDTL